MAKAIFSDNFERLVLKECYVDQYKHQDMTNANKHKAHSDQTAYIMYNKLKYKFDRVGYDLDDIKSITFYYTLHYFGMYSIANNPKERKKYDKRKEKQSIFITERNKLISFLRQRIVVLGEYCDRKSRNIIAGKDYRLFFAHTKDSVPASDAEIVKRHAELGYRKIIAKELKEIKKACGSVPDLVDKDGFKLVEVNHIDQGIKSCDYLDVSDMQNNIYYQKPQDVIINKETDDSFQIFVSKYKSYDKKRKVNLLKMFVNKHRLDPKYKEEIKIANRFLRNRELLDS